METAVKQGLGKCSSQEQLKHKILQRLYKSAGKCGPTDFETKKKQGTYCLENIIAFCFIEYISIFIYLISENLLIFMELPGQLCQRGVQQWHTEDMHSVVSTSTIFSIVLNIIMKLNY